MRGPYFLELANEQEAERLFQKIGCDWRGSQIMLAKSRIIPLFLKEVKSPGANILKQQMLSLGGEAVVGRGVVNCSQEYSDVLLLGTVKEYELLVEKIIRQPWGLNDLGERIKTLLGNLERKKSVTWEWPGRKLVLGEKVLVMGILNVTPDSFSDGGKFVETSQALEHAWEMVEAGADIIDLGGESTRPGGLPVSATEELKRVLPVLEKLLQEIPVPLSLDTYKAAVAEEALAVGVQIINDVGGGLKDPRMAEVAARFQAPVIIMHNPGKVTYQDLIPDLVDSLSEQVRIFEEAGLPAEKIVIDPGVGFGKDYQENLVVMKNLQSLCTLGKPVLLGVSRKSFIGKTLDLPVTDRLEGSLAAAAWGVLNGADILRVHDVRETVRLVKVLEAIKTEGVSGEGIR
ncbi:MAG: dihydropteroate synthase [Clostridia bacterium]|nr:dihydropteroate synthase [Clostridia bacterium]MDD4666127.1 dihydropteroate synthase [Clostridia bacterium]